MPLRDDSLPPTLTTCANPEAERYVLGSMLLRAEHLDEAHRRLSVENFSQYPYQLCFRTMLEMQNHGMQVDSHSLLAILREKKLDVELGVDPLGALQAMTAAAWSGVNFVTMVEMVSDSSRRRAAIMIGREMIRDLEDKVEPSYDTLIRFETRFGELLSLPTSKDAMPIGEAVEKGLAEIERKATTPNYQAVRSGFTELDNLVPEFEPGQLIIIGARTGIGKSAIALCMALNMAGMENRHCYYVSLEMKPTEFGQRFAALLSGVNVHMLKNPKTYQQRFMDRAKQIAIPNSKDVPLYIDQESTLSIPEIRAAVRREQRRSGPMHCLFVDYLQQVRVVNSRAQRREQVGSITRGLKELARELNIPVIALSQLSRASEDHGDGKPKLTDLREAGDIEQDADVVLLLYRSEVAPTVDDQTAGCIIAKQRAGPTGEIPLTFRKSLARYMDYVPPLG